MTAEQPSELLSAYLDGELGEEERAHVERLLRESADAQRLLLELRTVSEATALLPRRPAPKSLVGDVMRHVERRTLLGEEPSERLGASFVRKSKRVLYLAAAAIAVIVTAGVWYGLLSGGGNASAMRNVALHAPAEPLSDDIEKDSAEHRASSRGRSHGSAVPAVDGGRKRKEVVWPEWAADDGGVPREGVHLQVAFSSEALRGAARQRMISSLPTSETVRQRSVVRSPTEQSASSTGAPRRLDVERFELRLPRSWLPLLLKELQEASSADPPRVRAAVENRAVEGYEVVRWELMQLAASSKPVEASRESPAMNDAPFSFRAAMATTRDQATGGPPESPGRSLILPEGLLRGLGVDPQWLMPRAAPPDSASSRTSSEPVDTAAQASEAAPKNDHEPVPTSTITETPEAKGTALADRESFLARQMRRLEQVRRPPAEADVSASMAASAIPPQPVGQELVDPASLVTVHLDLFVQLGEIPPTPSATAQPPPPPQTNGNKVVK